MTTTNRTKRLADVTSEDQPERLVELIQNSTGNIPKEEREAAAIELTRRFQFLIRKVAKSLFRAYKLYEYGDHEQEYQDFFQDVLTEFYDLVINDFKIKEDRTDTGLAVFGSYIKVKLYRRVQWKLQEKLRRIGYENFPIAVDYDDILHLSATGKIKDGGMGSADPLADEIREAMIANALNYEDFVLEHISNQKCKDILDELLAISRDTKVVDERDRMVWEMYYLSGVMVGEIGQHIPSKLDDGKPIGRQRVLQIARNVNDRIVMEFGRRSAVRAIGL